MLDQCHNQIVHALQKDGWVVDPKPARLYADEKYVFIDIYARRNINGTRQRALFAEVKCFPDREDTSREVYTAIGQYIFYRTVLLNVGETTPLYLAIPDEVYEAIFRTIARHIIDDYKIKLILVNLEIEEIVQWRE